MVGFLSRKLSRLLALRKPPHQPILFAQQPPENTEGISPLFPGEGIDGTAHFPDGQQKRQRFFQFLKIGLLATVLGAHFLSRQHTASTIPLSARSFYSWVYRASLSLLAGRGFHLFHLTDTPAAQRIGDFLLLKEKTIPRRAFREFFHSPDFRTASCPLDDSLPSHPGIYADPHDLPISPLHTTRILDLYVAALVWKVCGISWSALFTFYALVSTASCGLVFLIARRLGGGFWPGWLAAVLYFACPLENDYAVRSIRDVCPLWFAVLGFWALTFLAERFRSPGANRVAAAATGLCAAVGCGWRPDALLLVPFLGAALFGLMIRRGLGWKEVGLRLGMYGVGAAGTLATINGLCQDVRQSPLVGFHMAYYGDAARCNVLGLENTFQVSRDDLQACFQVQYAQAVGGAGVPPYLGWEYGAACARLYRKVAPANAYAWIARFPEFFWHSLRACDLRDLPVGDSWFPPASERPRWMEYLRGHGLAVLSRAAAGLFFLGLAVGWAGPAPRVAGFLGLFAAYHAAALFAVLPEHKHAASLVLPLTVFAGIGTWALVRMVTCPTRTWQAFRSVGRTRWRIAALTLGAVSLIWLLAGAAAYRYARLERHHLIKDVLARAEKGKAVPESIKDSDVFSVRLPRNGGPDPVGFLLTIRGGEAPGELVCRHLRPAAADLPAVLFATRHSLRSHQEQFFFVSCLRGEAQGDVRDYVCTVTLSKGASLLGVVRMDLTGWSRPQVGTVFYPGQKSPGSPNVGRPTSWTVFGPPEERDPYGLPAEERGRHPGLFSAVR
jgi:hypothetical protein